MVLRSGFCYCRHFFLLLLMCLAPNGKLSGTYSAVKRLCAALCSFESFITGGGSEIVISMSAEPSLVCLECSGLWSGEGEKGPVGVESWP